MDTLSTLMKTTTKSKRRVGRGIGSKKGGHTTGRGNKGDKIRGKTKITFDGTKIKKGWIKRLPFLRGKHRVLAKPKISIVKLVEIEKHYQPNDIVDIKSLAKKLKINAPAFKVLSQGKLSKALTFKSLSLSSKAKAKIIAVGGKIES